MFYFILRINLFNSGAFDSVLRQQQRLHEQQAAGNRRVRNMDGRVVGMANDLAEIRQAMIRLEENQALLVQNQAHQAHLLEDLHQLMQIQPHPIHHQVPPPAVPPPILHAAALHPPQEPPQNLPMAEAEEPGANAANEALLMDDDKTSIDDDIPLANLVAQAEGEPAPAPNVNNQLRNQPIRQIELKGLPKSFVDLANHWLFQRMELCRPMNARQHWPDKMKVMWSKWVILFDHLDATAMHLQNNNPHLTRQNALKMAAEHHDRQRAVGNKTMNKVLQLIKNHRGVQRRQRRNQGI